MVEQLHEGKFFGRTTQIAHIARVRFVVSEYESGLAIPRHSHKFGHFCLVLDGSYVEKLEKREHLRKPATLVYLPSEVAHTEHHLARGRHLMIEPDSTWTDRLAYFTIFKKAQRSFVEGRALALAQRVFNESRCIDALSPLVIEGLILELFAEAWRPKRDRQFGAIPRWLKDIRELIEADFRKRISLTELARAADLHPGHLSRVFRHHFGCCIGDYQRRLRLEFALRRIVNSDEPLADIATSAGFTDQSHLSRQVKRYTGQSPHTLRSKGNND